MNIKINEIPQNYDGKECFVHARACAVDDNRMIMTMQKLNVKGNDLFEPLYVSHSFDGGKTWSEPQHDDAFLPVVDENNVRSLGCDAVHLFHKHTGTAIVMGHMVFYGENDMAPILSGNRYTFYSTYDFNQNKYKPIKIIDVPFDKYPKGCATGCSQFIEEANGDLLIPVSIRYDERYHYSSAVMRCSFDGENIRFKEMSNELCFDVERGLYEPSICFFEGKYYLTLRNDQYGFYSTSEDGRTFSEPEMWKWDTGDILPNYNTQQHWLICGGKLYLVYTRRAGNNDHVFRHRAPLFMSEVDTDKMQILRKTEKIVAPERGARLGNFGVTHVNDLFSLITVTEWMQPIGCEKYGSNNSLFVTHVNA